jgi:mono/diheme cytochrome c family protein
MPSWRHLPETERSALIAYLKTFSPRFQRQTPEPAIPIPGAPKDLDAPARIARGKALYVASGCSTCHGESGKGDGPSAKTLVDSEQNPIVPFDFTRRSPKGGARPEDLYRTFMTGINGTPMPSFAPTTENDQQRWDIVAYVLSLRNQDQKDAP